MIALLRFELLGILRDRRTLLLSIVAPILMLPLMVTGLQRFTQHIDRQASPDVYHIVIKGSQAAELRLVVSTHSPPATIVQAGSTEEPTPIFREVELPGSTLQALREGKVDLVVDASNPPQPPQDPEEDARSPRDPSAPKPPPEGKLFRRRQPGRALVKLFFAADVDRSMNARDHYDRLLRSVISRYRDAVLEQHDITRGDFLGVEMVDTADQATRNRTWVASLFPLIMMSLLVSGASVAAVDSLAGERERGTWETLLTSCLSRVEIVAAKQITVTLVAVVVSGTQLANLLLNWKLGWVKLPQGFTLDFPTSSLVLTGALALIQANFVSSLLLYASARSGSFKEAQLLFFPLFVTCLVLGAASLLPDLGLQSLAILVPIAGLNVAMRSALLGHADVPTLALGIAISVGTSLWLSRACLKRLLAEGQGATVDDADPEEQKRLNLREQVTWVYALAAAAILIVPGNIPALSSLAGQVLFNQGGMLLIGFFLLRHHHIDLRRALRLRTVPVLVWPLAVCLGPLLQLCANSLVLATQALLPVPEEMTRQMTDLLLPSEMGLAPLLALLALSPAICEEIAFRGVFMYAFMPPARSPSLSARARCAALVGLVFGLFHLSIYRLLPTAVIGTALAVLAFCCGSIVPGMIVHFLNNGLAVVFEKVDLDVTALPTWIFWGAWPAALVVLLTIRRLCARP